MKRTIRNTTVILAAAISLLSFASCTGGTSGTSNNSEAASQTGTASQVSTASQSGTASDTQQSAEASAVKEADYSKPDLTIADGDFAAMESFLSDWGENKWDDKVIRITGVNARRISNCTIMEKDSSGTGKGCSWVITDGKFPDDYPADDAKITITGILRYDPQNFSRILEVPADKVETA